MRILDRVGVGFETRFVGHVRGGEVEESLLGVLGPFAVGDGYPAVRGEIRGDGPARVFQGPGESAFEIGERDEARRRIGQAQVFIHHGLVGRKGEGMLDPQAGQGPAYDQPVAFNRNVRVNQLEERRRVFVAGGVGPIDERAIRQPQSRPFVIENGAKASGGGIDCQPVGGILDGV